MTISSRDGLVAAQKELADLELAMADARKRLHQQPRILADMLTMHRFKLGLIREEIEEYLGLHDLPRSTYELRFAPIENPNAHGVTPLSALELVVSNFRGAIGRLAHGIGGVLNERGRTRASIISAVDLNAFATAGGSFTLLLEPPPQASVTEAPLAERAIALLEETANWVDSTETVQPSSLANEKLRLLALRQVQRLAPSGDSPIAWVEIARASPETGYRKTFRLTPTTFERSTSLIKTTVGGSLKVEEGVLRAIDLDKKKFALRVEGKRDRVPCTLPEDLETDAARHVANQQRVRVFGEMRNGVLHVESLEQLREIQTKIGKRSKKKAPR